MAKAKTERVSPAAEKKKGRKAPGPRTGPGPARAAESGTSSEVQRRAPRANAGKKKSLRSRGGGRAAAPAGAGRARVTPPIEKGFDPDRWNNTEKIILARRSTRLYQKKQVPEAMVRRILECGRYAPSEGNYQPWRTIVVRDPKVLRDMEADATRAISRMWDVINYRDHPWRKYHTKLLQFLTPNNLHPIPSGAIRSVAEGKFHVLWNAPMAILLLKDKRGIGNPDLDIGITGTNMVIAAHSMGLGTCWIGVISVLMFYDKWRKFFNIRYPWYLEQALLLGFPVGDPDGFVHRETHAVDWIDEDGRRTVT